MHARLAARSGTAFLRVAGQVNRADAFLAKLELARPTLAASPTHEHFVAAKAKAPIDLLENHRVVTNAMVAWATESRTI